MTDITRCWRCRSPMIAGQCSNLGCFAERRPGLEQPEPYVGARFSWMPDEPRARTSPRWYLAWPAPVIDLVRGNPMNTTWFCMPAIVEEATEFRPRRVYAAYCGAPASVRCRCGAQLAGHDPGDEQP